MGDSRTSRRYLAQVAEREHQAVELYLSGQSLQSISDTMSLGGRSNAHKVVTRGLSKRAAERADLTDHALTVTLERLERLLHAHYEKALNGDHRAAELALRIIDRQIKVLGLDAPVRVDATVHTVTDVDREIATLTEALTSAAAQRGVPLPDMPALTAIITPPDDTDPTTEETP